MLKVTIHHRKLVADLAPLAKEHVIVIAFFRSKIFRYLSITWRIILRCAVTYVFVDKFMRVRLEQPVVMG